MYKNDEKKKFQFPFLMVIVKLTLRRFMNIFDFCMRKNINCDILYLKLEYIGEIT